MPSYNSLACDAVIEGLERLNLEHFCFIPCSTVAKIVEHFEAKESIHSFPVSREEDGVGIVSGISLAGGRVVLLIQDTGIGNSLLALTSFCLSYHIPLLILVTRRGGLGEINSAVYSFSEKCPEILEVSGLKTFRLDYRVPLLEWPTAIEQAYEYAQSTHRPIVVMMNLKGGVEQV
ncbi:hypothetical protein LLE49_22310 [Alicyclobacillus tolerans]|uniref:thiamine pyrophosphate-binding protein n=1 Tax=Alicyclobacillus tolerans TaxID=90970 RepID=UPI001F1AC71D|nr:thiamine pyrophosphate-binding protein [Alicyclobacillus tolerans]MCF8567456.1 hypothetical protein [Alicyclobacillus tolerans]